MKFSKRVKLTWSMFWEEVKPKNTAIKYIMMWLKILFFIPLGVIAAIAAMFGALYLSGALLLSLTILTTNYLHFKSDFNFDLVGLCAPIIMLSILFGFILYRLIDLSILKLLRIWNRIWETTSSKALAKKLME